MARGKISYWPPRNRALVLDGSHWLTLPSPLGNPGAGDFGWNGLLYVSSTSLDNEIHLITKAPLNLDGQRGWQLIYRQDYQCLGLRINDGQELCNLYLSPVGSAPLDTWIGFHFALDRDGDPQVSLQGVAGDGYIDLGEFDVGEDLPGGSLPPTAYPGSLDNDEPLRLGGYNGVSHGLVGLIDLVRYDPGRALPAAWFYDEWNRLRYGYPRNMDWVPADFEAAWEFNDTLLDEAGNYAWSYQGGGAPVYADGWPYAVAPLTVLFEHNYAYGHALGHLEQDDAVRTLDGSYQSYAPQVRKRRFRLPFNRMPHSQMTALMAAFASGDTINLYLDANYPRTCRGRIVSPPEHTSQECVRGNLTYWDGDLEWEEI
jgi:hypothetical protein